MNETLDEMAYASEETGENYKLRDISIRSNIAIGFLIGTLVLLGVELYFSLQLSSSLTLAMAENYDSIRPLRIILWLGSIISVCFWVGRATYNAHALQLNPALNTSVGMSVGSFFIPIANLFLPFIAIRDAWKASKTIDGSAQRDSYMKISAGTFLVFWWVLYLVKNIPYLIGGNIKTRVLDGNIALSRLEEEGKQMFLYFSVGHVFSIAAGIMLILVIRDFKRLQSSKPEWVR